MAIYESYMQRLFVVVLRKLTDTAAEFVPCRFVFLWWHNSDMFND